MNETSLTIGPRTPGLPGPSLFEPGTSELPPSLAADVGTAEPIVLLVDVADDPRWAAEAAVEIAAAWARAGRRVVLADLHLEDPILHERVGEPNLDGIVDIFLYGASVARSARPPQEHDFFFIPAGTYTARPQEVYAHSRWEQLTAGFREAEASLLVFAPGDAPGVENLARRAATGVFLGEPDAGQGTRLALAEVRAVLVPRLDTPAPTPTEPPSVGASVEPGEAPAEEPAAGVPPDEPLGALPEASLAGVGEAEEEALREDLSAASADEEPELREDDLEDFAGGRRAEAAREGEVSHTLPAPAPQPAGTGDDRKDHVVVPVESATDEELPLADDPRKVDEYEARGEAAGVEWETREPDEAPTVQPAPIPAWELERRRRDAGLSPSERRVFPEEPGESPLPWDDADHEIEEREVERFRTGEREPAGARTAARGAEDFLPAEAGAGDAMHEERPPELPPPPGIGGTRRRRRSGPGPMIWLLVGVAVLAAAVLIVAFLRPDLFGIDRMGARLEPTDALGAVEAIPAAPATPVPAGDTLPWAVQVRAFQTFRAAHGEAQRAARRVPEIPHYVVPEQVQGVLYYKVIAGLLPDTAAAAELRRRLVATGVVDARDARDDAPGAWNLIQHRPLAFHLGEFTDPEQAYARADSALAGDIHAYTVTVPYTDGTERWRVYAGAFPDSARAEDQRLLLQAAGLPARLVTRVGRAPEAAQ